MAMHLLMNLGRHPSDSHCRIYRMTTNDWESSTIESRRTSPHFKPAMIPCHMLMRWWVHTQLKQKVLQSTAHNDR